MMTEREINYEMLRACLGVKEGKRGVYFRLGKWDAERAAFSPDGKHGHIFPASWCNIKQPQGALTTQFRGERLHIIGAEPLVKMESGRTANRIVVRKFYHAPTERAVWLNEHLLKEFKQLCYAAGSGSAFTPVFLFESIDGDPAHAELTGFIYPEKEA